MTNTVLYIPIKNTLEMYVFQGMCNYQSFGEGSVFDRRRVKAFQVGKQQKTLKEIQLKKC
jgi:hypothetical protein